MRIQKIKNIMLGIFLLGFISGIIYTNLVAKTYIITMGIFSDFFLEQYSKSKINMNNYSWYIFKLRFAPAVFLALTSLTKLKRIAGGIFLLWTSFLCGFMCCVHDASIYRLYSGISDYLKLYVYISGNKME